MLEAEATEELTQTTPAALRDPRVLRNCSSPHPPGENAVSDSGRLSLAGQEQFLSAPHQWMEAGMEDGG